MKNLLLFILLFILLLLGLTASAFEEQRGSRVSWARLKFRVSGGSYDESQWDWFAHPTGDIQMIDFIRKKSTVNLKDDWNVADVEELEEMCAFPFIFVHGQRKQNLTQRGKDNLKEYLLRGGFIFIDDCVWRYKDTRYQDICYQSFVVLLKELLPEAKFELMDVNHPLFSCYYRIEEFPHCQGINNGISLVTLHGRPIAIITSSDLHCAWVTEEWFGANKRMEALKMGVNIYVYSMCY